MFAVLSEGSRIVPYLAHDGVGGCDVTLVSLVNAGPDRSLSAHDNRSASKHSWRAVEQSCVVVIRRRSRPVGTGKDETPGKTTRLEDRDDADQRMSMILLVSGPF